MSSGVSTLTLGAVLPVSMLTPPAHVGTSVGTASKDAPRTSKGAPQGAKSAEAKSPRPAGSPGSVAKVVQWDFVVGPENRLAASVIEGVLETATAHDDASQAEQAPHAGQVTRYNPLVFYGPTGVGKTHLVAGLASRWKLAQQQHAQKRRAQQQGEATDAAPAKATASKAGAASVLYLTASDFARQLAEALENERPGPWRAKIRGADLLVIDGLGELSGKRIAQQELQQTIDAVLDAGGQVVLTAPLSPDQMASLAPSLAARLVAGLTVPVAAPGPEARTVLLTRLAAARGIELSATAAKTLAELFAATVPELHGTLVELAMQSQLEEQPLTAERVRAFLLARQGENQPTVRSIAVLTAKYFGLKVGELKSASRRRAVVQARGVAVFLARQMTGKSLEHLGTHFGGRDHTTVLHSYRTIESRLRADPTLRQAVTDIRRLVSHS